MKRAIERRPMPDPVSSPAVRAAVWTLQLGALACVVAALPYQLFDLDRHSVPKELVLHLAAFLSAMLCLSAARKVRLQAVDLFLGAYVLLSLASTAFATNSWLALRSFALTASGAAAFWSARAVAGAGLGPRLLATLAAGTVLAASTALAQAYGLVTSLASLSRAPGGTFGNRNFMAHLLAIGLPVLVWCALRARRRLYCVLWCMGISAVFAALVLSRSRAAWLAVGLSCAGALVLALLSGPGTRTTLSGWRLLGLLVAAAVGVSGAVGLPNQLDWRSPTPYVDTAKSVVDYTKGSGRGRLIQYRNTLGMVLDHPLLGIGPGNWPVAYPRYGTRRDPSFNASLPMPTNPWPSSDWVAVASERGIPALVLILAAGASLWADGWRRSRGPWGADGSGPVLGAAVLSLATVGSFDAVLHLPAPTFYFWAIAGALLPGGDPVQTVFLEPRGRRMAAIALLAATGALFAARSCGQILAMRAAGSSRSPASLELAAKLDPGSYRIRMLLAGTWIDRGRCDKAWPHALAASRLFPYLPAPKRLLQQCGGAARTH